MVKQLIAACAVIVACVAGILPARAQVLGQLGSVETRYTENSSAAVTMQGLPGFAGPVASLQVGNGASSAFAVLLPPDDEKSGVGYEISYDFLPNGNGGVKAGEYQVRNSKILIGGKESPATKKGDAIAHADLLSVLTIPKEKNRALVVATHHYEVPAVHRRPGFGSVAQILPGKTEWIGAAITIRLLLVRATPELWAALKVIPKENEDERFTLLRLALNRAARNTGFLVPQEDYAPLDLLTAPVEQEKKEQAKLPVTFKEEIISGRRSLRIEPVAGQTPTLVFSRDGQTPDPVNTKGLVILKNALVFTPEPEFVGKETLTVWLKDPESGILQEVLRWKA